MLIDNNAHLIYHPDIETDTPFETGQSLSLAKYEPDITYHLQSRGHIIRSSCDDFAWKTRYNTLKVTLDTPYDNTDSYPAIYVSPIQDTNVFLIIKVRATNFVMYM